jgi:cytosine/adenosine deaminase-related metal-dependent hydrolase
LVDENSGEILEIPLKNSVTIENVNHIQGDLIPGFINTHCHLELSHIFNKIPTQTGMRGFVQAINTYRNASTPEQELRAIQDANAQMWHNGIVAVGDISNDDRSADTKEQSKIYYHTFIELFGWDQAQYEALFVNAQKWQIVFKKAGDASIVPHAPYSVPPILFSHLREIGTDDKIWTIHHAESDAEMSLFKEGKGDLADFLKMLSVELSSKTFNNCNNPTSYLISEWPKEKKSIWVHNTRMEEPALLLAMGILKENLFLCTCPNANLYIEDRLPDYEMWIRNGAQICIGTDSLASNHSLSIWDEIMTIRKHVDITLEQLLTWATINGAKALGIDSIFGSFEKGKKPGILHIDSSQNIQRLF